MERAKQRLDRIQSYTSKLKSSSGISELEQEPAFKRKNINLNDIPHSSEEKMSKFTLSEEEENGEIKTGLKGNNSFLHDNVDQINVLFESVKRSLCFGRRALLFLIVEFQWFLLANLLCHNGITEFRRGVPTNVQLAVCFTQTCLKTVRCVVTAKYYAFLSELLASIAK